MLTEIGKLFHPLFHALAYILVFWYGLVPNYAVAIALFTVTVMVVLAPLTIKSTRSMLAMQRLQPEANKLKEKYKNDKMAQQTEIMALYKANGVNPAGGCLPMLIQLPVFFVLYRMIEGLTRTVLVTKVRTVEPEYISHTSLLYKNLVAAHGAMTSFGMNLAKAATSSHGSFLAALPFYGLLVVCIGLQFVQMRQLSSRSPKQTGAAAQTQAVMKFMPLIFGFIYLAIPAGVNVYFLVSSLFRIGQQELMYRFDPQVRGHAEAVKEADNAEQGVVVRGSAKLSSDEPAQGGLFASLRAARAELLANAGAKGTTKTSDGRPTTRASARLPTKESTTRPGTTPAKAKSAAKARTVPTPKTDTGARTEASPANGRGTSDSNGTGAGPSRPQAQSGTRSKVVKPGGSGSKPKSGTKPSVTPNGARLPSEQARPASNGAGPTAKPNVTGRSGSRTTKLPKDSASPNDSSWARRPREAATVVANEARAPARTTTQPARSPSKQPRDRPDPSPNRSRAKRARRPR